MNKESLIEYIKINEFSEEFLKVNMAEMLSAIQDQLGEGVTVTGLSDQAMESITAVMDEETRAALFQNYVLPFEETLEEASVKELDVAYNDLSATISYTGFKANLGKLADTTVADLNTLKEDADTLNLLNSFASEGELNAEVIDQAIEAINNAKAENNLAAIDAEAMYGVSEDGSAMGGYLDISVGDEIMKVAEFVAFPTDAGIVGEAFVGLEDENYGVQFEIADQNTFVITSNHAGIMKAVGSVDGNTSKLVITPVTDYEGAPLADFEGFALELSETETPDGGNAALKVIYNDEEMVAISGTVGEGTPIELPDLTDIDGTDINDDEAMNAYMDNVDPSDFLEKLIAAGVPEDLIFGTEETE